MPAEPKLLEYAYRVKQDVPFEADVVKFEKMTNRIEEDIDDEVSGPVTFDNKKTPLPKVELKMKGFESVIEHSAFDESTAAVDDHFLTNSYEKVVNIFGRFQQESIALGLSELR
jgi:hypothetical protein